MSNSLQANKAKIMAWNGATRPAKKIKNTQYEAGRNAGSRKKVENIVVQLLPGVGLLVEE